MSFLNSFRAVRHFRRTALSFFDFMTLICCADHPPAAAGKRYTVSPSRSFACGVACFPFTAIRHDFSAFSVMPLSGFCFRISARTSGYSARMVSASAVSSLTPVFRRRVPKSFTVEASSHPAGRSSPSRGRGNSYASSAPAAPGSSGFRGPAACRSDASAACRWRR